jgi:ABC-2 type transport system permease protein
MKALLALIEREYLEHKAAFVIAPTVILALLALVLVSATALDRIRIPAFIATSSARVLEIGLLLVAGLWFVYLMASLFFYFADAFNADRRNNAMLFWKSMPVSDFKMLGAKMLAGLTVFPALILLAILATSVLVVGFAFIAADRLPIGGLDLGTVLSAAGHVGLFVIVWFALGLLWYAPFFAWVGLLSALVGRWSIPLAILVPGMIGMFERLLLGGDGPRHGYFLEWLGNRFQFAIGEETFMQRYIDQPRFDAVAAIGDILASIDWASLVGGLAVTMLFVYAASEYRRRFIAA